MNPKSCRLFASDHASDHASKQDLEQSCNSIQGNSASSHPPASAASHLLEPIADAIERFDHVEVVVRSLEFLAQTLDVTIDGAVIHIDLIIVGGIHERVPALDDPWPACKRL